LPLAPPAAAGGSPVLRTQGGRPPRAMVLAAGLGTRLRPLTDRLPKPLVPLFDQPLLAYNLRLLASLGVREVVINVFGPATQIRTRLGDGRALGLELRYSEETTLLGTGGGVRRQLAWLGEHGTFLVLNGDTIVAGDLAGAWARHQRRAAQATLLLHAHSEAAAYGAVDFDAHGRITALGSLLGPAPASSLLFGGVHFLEPELLADLSPDASACLIRDAYVPALRRGLLLCGDPALTSWADLGTPARYLAAHQTLLRQPGRFPHAGGAGATAAPAPEPGSLTRVEPCWLGPGVQSRGPAVVGPDAVIGAGTTLAAGIELQRCVVWPGSTVTRSLTDGIWLTDGEFVAVAG